MDDATRSRLENDVEECEGSSVPEVHQLGVDIRAALQEIHENRQERSCHLQVAAMFRNLAEKAQAELVKLRGER